MRRETIFAVAPFALVAVLAAGVALAGFIASPRARLTLRDANTECVRLSIERRGLPSPAAKASPSSTASAGATGPKSNDAGDMLRVHNELRAVIERRRCEPMTA